MRVSPYDSFIAEIGPLWTSEGPQPMVWVEHNFSAEADPWVRQVQERMGLHPRDIAYDAAVCGAICVRGRQYRGLHAGLLLGRHLTDCSDRIDEPPSRFNGSPVQYYLPRRIAELMESIKIYDVDFSDVRVVDVGIRLLGLLADYPAGRLAVGELVGGLPGTTEFFPSRYQEIKPGHDYHHAPPLPRSA